MFSHCLNLLNCYIKCSVTKNLKLVLLLTPLCIFSEKTNLNEHDKRSDSLRTLTVLFAHHSLFLFCFCTHTVSRRFLCLHSAHPVHSQEDAWLSPGVAVVRVLHPRAIPQPGPLELTRFPLGALLQIILYEVFLLCAQHVLLLLSAVVVRWKMDSNRRGTGGE